MSFNIKIVGSKKNVKAAVLALPTVPQPVKDTVALFCDSGTGDDAYAGEMKAVQVTSYGHYDPKGGSTLGQLTIELVQLAPDDAPAADAAPQAT